MTYNQKVAHAIQIFNAMKTDNSGHDHGWVWTRKQLAERTGLSERTVSTVLKTLKDNKFVFVTAGAYGGAQRNNNIMISVYDLMVAFGDDVQVEDEKMRSLLMAALSGVFVP